MLKCDSEAGHDLSLPIQTNSLAAARYRSRIHPERASSNRRPHQRNTAYHRAE